MSKLMGWRKVIMFTESLITFSVIVVVMGLRDSAAIVAVGGVIAGFLGAGVLGNVKVHQQEGEVK